MLQCLWVYFYLLSYGTPSECECECSCSRSLHRAFRFSAVLWCLWWNDENIIFNILQFVSHGVYDCVRALISHFDIGPNGGTPREAMEEANKVTNKQTYFKSLHERSRQCIRFRFDVTDCVQDSRNVKVIVWDFFYFLWYIDAGDEKYISYLWQTWTKLNFGLKDNWSQNNIVRGRALLARVEADSKLFQ